MTVFKFVISDKAKSYQVEKDQKDCPIVGKKIGEKIDGGFLGLADYELEITGGSDKDGFPMRKDVEGLIKRKIILTRSIGFKAKESGLRKRRTVRGNTIGLDVVQVNCRVVKPGAKPLDEIFVKPKTEEKKE